MPPNEFLDFGKQFGVENIIFVDDDKCERSLRYYNDIFIKITGKWDVYVLFPFEAKAFSEMITLRFLHEVGHVYYNHSGSLNNTKNLNIQRASDPWTDIFSGDEGQAWLFSFKIRKYKKEQYDKLIRSFEDFMENTHIIVSHKAIII